MSITDIESTPTFDRVIKKLHAKERALVNSEISAIANNFLIGFEKKGDLAEVFVHKFKINAQEFLLAYRVKPDKVAPVTLELISIGSHENFYQKLKR